MAIVPAGCQDAFLYGDFQQEEYIEQPQVMLLRGRLKSVI